MPDDNVTRAAVVIEDHYLADAADGECGCGAVHSPKHIAKALADAGLLAPGVSRYSWPDSDHLAEQLQDALGRFADEDCCSVEEWAGRAVRHTAATRWFAERGEHRQDIRWPSCSVTSHEHGHEASE